MFTFGLMGRIPPMRGKEVMGWEVGEEKGGEEYGEDIGTLQRKGVKTRRAVFVKKKYIYC